MRNRKKGRPCYRGSAVEKSKLYDLYYCAGLTYEEIARVMGYKSKEITRLRMKHYHITLKEVARKIWYEELKRRRTEGGIGNAKREKEM